MVNNYILALYMSDEMVEHKIICTQIKLMRPIFIVLIYAAVKSTCMFEFLNICLGYQQPDTQPAPGSNENSECIVG